MQARQPLSSLGILLTAAGIATVAQAQADSTDQPKPCSAPEYRQFDFWIGEWDVTNPQGQPAGNSVITKTLDGCVIHEAWQSASSPFAGYSHNIYDAGRKVWHQSWVDNTGLLLQLDGEYEGGKMILVGERPAAEGGSVLNRISWEKISDDEVRQLWESSSDGGKTWQVLFDGKYVRKEIEKGKEGK
ncbi:MAG: hypothetical protein JSW51_14670 [Gemmatimonadota bacterium]|nr:MAG: hypothetical protein JSW51_14670 [Gemmatimonadota bacterium]